MKKTLESPVVSPTEISLGLDELMRECARRIIKQAIEAEVSHLLEQLGNVRTLNGRQAVVRNGHLPERGVLTAAGPVTVKVPKVRDRSGAGVKFNSVIVPPYVRKSPRVNIALPWLYLKGVSNGDMSETLKVLLGDDAKGLSAKFVCRLKEEWSEEHRRWSQRDLCAKRYVSWWGRWHPHRGSRQRI
jgi:putative transposase